MRRRRTDDLIDKTREDKICISYDRQFGRDNWLYVCTWDMRDTIPEDNRIAMLCAKDCESIEDLRPIIERIAIECNLSAPCCFRKDNEKQVSWLQPIDD